MSRAKKLGYTIANGMIYRNYIAESGNMVTIGKDIKTGYYSKYSAEGMSAGNTKETIEAIYGIEIQH